MANLFYEINQFTNRIFYPLKDLPLPRKEDLISASQNVGEKFFKSALSKVPSKKSVLAIWSVVLLTTPTPTSAWAGGNYFSKHNEIFSHTPLIAYIGDNVQISHPLIEQCLYINENNQFLRCENDIYGCDFRKIVRYENKMPIYKGISDTGFFTMKKHWGTSVAAAMCQTTPFAKILPLVVPYSLTSDELYTETHSNSVFNALLEAVTYATNMNADIIVAPFSFDMSDYHNFLKERYNQHPYNPMYKQQLADFENNPHGPFQLIEEAFVKFNKTIVVPAGDAFPKNEGEETLEWGNKKPIDVKKSSNYPQMKSDEIDNLIVVSRVKNATHMSPTSYYGFSTLGSTPTYLSSNLFEGCLLPSCIYPKEEKRTVLQAAVVAGLIAELVAIKPTLRGKEIKDILFDTAINVPANYEVLGDIGTKVNKIMNFKAAKKRVKQLA